MRHKHCNDWTVECDPCDGDTHVSVEVAALPQNPGDGIRAPWWLLLPNSMSSRCASSRLSGSEVATNEQVGGSRCASCGRMVKARALSRTSTGDRSSAKATEVREPHPQATDDEPLDAPLDTPR